MYYSFMRFRKHPVSLALMTAVAMASCSKNNSASTVTGEVHYAVSNVAGAYPSQTTYVQGLANLNISQLSNANAAESPNFASQWTYDGAVYLTSFGAPATITKYTFDATGKAVVAGKLVVPGANTFSSVEFVSKTEAYASVGGGLARIVKFNPTALQTTGEINLSAFAKPGAASVYYLGMKARDGKLFLGIQYFNASFNPLADSAFVGVIDLAAGKTEKLLADARTSNIFLAGSSVSGFATDAAGDLYIQGQGSGAAPSGVLRIRKGATSFDADYFFNLKAATGKDCSGLYILNNQAFTTRIEDATDAYETKGPNYRYYRIDLAGKTSLGDLSASLPKIYGSSTSIMRAFDAATVSFVVSSDKENSIYTYNVADGSVARKITLSAGMCTGFDKVN